MKIDRIYGFDALRAFSVGLVMLSHAGVIAATKGTYWADFFTVFNASYGVKTFFVLSGFLITSQLIAEHDRHGSISVPRFMLRRAFRILPLYFLVLAVVCILVYLGIAQNQSISRIMSATLTFNFVSNADNVNYLAHLWSLAVEEQFYLFWPLVCSATIMGYSVIARRWPLACFAVAVIALCLWKLYAGYGAFANTHAPWFWTIPAIYPIMIGALIAIMINAVAPVARSILALVASLAAMCLPLYVTMGPTFELISTLGIAGLIAWVYLNQKRRVVRYMDWGPIGYTGAISYGLYMWQGLLGGNGSYREPPFIDFPIQVEYGVLLAIPVAMISFHFFEQPLINLRKQIEPKRSST
ncbi:MAG: acyltransferase [Xanthobacteraceae bacterium]